MSEKHWSDGVSDGLIARMKDNREAYGLIEDPALKAAFQVAISAGVRLLYYDHHGQMREKASGDTDLLIFSIYRLPADWQRPEPEEEWIYCDVESRDGRWMVVDIPGYQMGKFAPSLVAFHRVGCGGVEFKEKPGTFYGDGHIRYVRSNGELFHYSDREDPHLATPNRVRYHRPTLVAQGIIS